MTNLAKNLTDTTRTHAGRVAVRVDNAAMTYRALEEASARVAGLLHERGLKPGNRVGIMMPNVAEVPVVYYGVLRAGGVVVPMNPLLKAREVAYYLGDSGAGLIFAWHAFADQARAGAEQAEAESIVVDAVGFPDLLASSTPDYQVADTSDDDTAVILYTSGTTGHPKGAELTHGNLRNQPCVVLTGAGVSTESGIPDFRSPTGIWAEYDPYEVASIDAFRRDPDAVWEFYARRLGRRLPTRSRTLPIDALAELEARGLVQAMITQNVDGLHPSAGSRAVIEVHGSIATASCHACGRREDASGCASFCRCRAARTAGRSSSRTS